MPKHVGIIWPSYYARPEGPKCMRRVKHLRVDVPYMWKFEFCRRTQMLMYAYIADVRNWFKLKRFYLGQDNNLGKSISPMVDEIWQPHILGELGDIPIHPCRCYSMTKIILKSPKSPKITLTPYCRKQLRFDVCFECLNMFHFHTISVIPTLLDSILNIV